MYLVSGTKMVAMKLTETFGDLSYPLVVILEERLLSMEALLKQTQADLRAQKEFFLQQMEEGKSSSFNPHAHIKESK